MMTLGEFNNTCHAYHFNVCCTLIITAASSLSTDLSIYQSICPCNAALCGQVVEDDVFPDGTVVKKGAKVLYSVYAMGRLESIWGKDCRDYKPERWLRNGRLMGESAYKFPAFNGGPRLCLGRDFAYYQMKFVAASILHRYRVEVAAGHPVEPKIALTLYMKHGLLVTLRRRDEA